MPPPLPIHLNWGTSRMGFLSFLQETQMPRPMVLFMHTALCAQPHACPPQDARGEAVGSGKVGAGGHVETPYLEGARSVSGLCLSQF